MKIKHIIIHNIEKEVGMPPKIQYSEHEMDLFDNKVYTLISNLYDFFSRTIKYGIFPLMLIIFSIVNLMK
mgnify:CR=1 FL=1